MQNINNQQKKEWLNRYSNSLKRTKSLELEIMELRSRKTSISISYDDMPHAHNTTDLSSYAAKLDSMEREYFKLLDEQIAIRKEIVNTIGTLEDETQKLVMTCRYVCGMTWERIATTCYYDVRTIHRIHGYALNNLIIE